MAEASLLRKHEVDQSHSSVQELMNRGVEVPDRYRYQDPPFGAISSSFPSVEIPVIDFNHLTTPEEIQKLHSALSSWGCFQVLNLFLFLLFFFFSFFQVINFLNIKMKEVIKRWFFFFPGYKSWDWICYSGSSKRGCQKILSSYHGRKAEIRQTSWWYSRLWNWYNSFRQTNSGLDRPPLPCNKSKRWTENTVLAWKSHLFQVNDFHQFLQCKKLHQFVFIKVSILPAEKLYSSIQQVQRR